MTLVPKTSAPPVCDLTRNFDGPRLPPPDINSYPYLWDLYPYLNSLEEQAARRNQLVKYWPAHWEWPMHLEDYYPGERVIVDEKGFRVDMDVGKFKPHEIVVKTDDNFVIVEGNQGKRRGGFSVVERHFKQKYLLPRGFNANHVISDISKDGILTIKVPPPPTARLHSSGARLVPIQETFKRLLPWRHGRF